MLCFEFHPSLSPSHHRLYLVIVRRAEFQQRKTTPVEDKKRIYATFKEKNLAGVKLNGAVRGHTDVIQLTPRPRPL